MYIEATISLDTALEVIGTLQAWAAIEDTETSRKRYIELEKEKYIILSSKRGEKTERENIFQKIINEYCPQVRETRANWHK